MQLAADLAQAQREITQLRGGLLQLGREVPERGDRLLGLCGQRRRALPLVRSDGARGGGGALAELGDVPDPLPLGAELVLLARHEAVRVLDQRSQLREARRRRVGVAGKLVVAPPGGGKVAPGDAGLAAALLLLGPAERVQHVELIGGASQAALLELPRHGDQALRRGGHVLAGDRAPPRVRARPSVAEHAPREHDPGFVLGPQLRQRRELLVVEEPVGDVELGLHVGLSRRGPDRRGIALRAEQQPDRLGEDGLPRPGLAGERVQARRQLEIRLADEDEILDPEAAQHGRIVDPPGRGRRVSTGDTVPASGRRACRRGARPYGPKREGRRSAS